MGRHLAVAVRKAHKKLHREPLWKTPGGLGLERN